MPRSALALLLAAALAAQEDPEAAYTAVAQRWVGAFNAGDYASLQADFAPQMVAEFPLEKSIPFYKEMKKDLGKIVRLGPPRLLPPRQALFHARGELGDMDIRVFLDEKGKISGLRFLPPTAELPVPSRNETPLSLPLRGRWRVLWGGDTRALNHHHDVPNQRFAFDFVATDDTGSTHRGDGASNDDYFAFGRDILAPADGTVVEAIDGVKDNAPGSMNPYSALGNAVVIRHRDHEVSVLAHLKLRSIRVRPGEEVRRGQVVGACGNSGNSSEPHLHYHLQNSPVLQDGVGIKVFFSGDAKAPYSPIKGDLVPGKN